MYFLLPFSLIKLFPLLTYTAVGFASAPAEGPNFVQTLFKKADARMYEQKQQQEAEKHPE